MHIIKNIRKWEHGADDRRFVRLCKKGRGYALSHSSMAFS